MEGEDGEDIWEEEGAEEDDELEEDRLGGREEGAAAEQGRDWVGERERERERDERAGVEVCRMQSLDAYAGGSQRTAAGGPAGTDGLAAAIALLKARARARKEAAAAPPPPLIASAAAALAFPL